MIRPEHAVKQLVDAGLLAPGQEEKALSVLRAKNHYPDLNAWLIQAGFWMNDVGQAAEARGEYGGDLRQLALALEPATDHNWSSQHTPDWERALELVLVNMASDPLENLEKLEQPRGRERGARPREQLAIYLFMHLVGMDGVSDRNKFFSVFARWDPEGASLVLPHMSEGHIQELRADALEPLRTHADPAVREAAASVLDRLGSSAEPARHAAKGR
jgi:hypothetical protein